MNIPAINVTRTNILLTPDASRVLLRPFVPGDKGRIEAILARILTLTEERVALLLEEIGTGFSRRHRDIQGLFLERFEQVSASLGANTLLSEPRRMLIGSYFLAEYSVESAALFNPSLVPHPDQTGLPPGALRFVLSLRATGEGHISSITFRTGIIHQDGGIEVVAPTGLLTEPKQILTATYERPLFERTMKEIGLFSDFTRRVIGHLDERFNLGELRGALDAELAHEKAGDGILQADQNDGKAIWTLACSNHEVQFQSHQQLSERILFPATPSQRNGIEDARFVHFRDDDGAYSYYATFTAYDGRTVMPELVETKDFLRFRFVTLNGPAAQNKGMALFPRKINGLYAMLSRQDGESIHIMFSGNIHFWNERKPLLQPRFPWEMVQLGNCGSPMETEAGWLVLTHGVGPMRKYCIGAVLLDLEDPTKVIGRLHEPLLQPNESEREGYVPNVVYTCGAIIHNKELIIPYGLSDRATRFATAPLDDVLAAMEP